VNLSFFIARRYFLSKRKKNFINFISVLSMLGVAFATAALIVVLSVFNGLGELMRSLYTAFDPQLKIEAVRGKSFEFTDSLQAKIKQVEGVDILTEVIEDYVYIRYRQPDAMPAEAGYEDESMQHYQMPKGEAEMVVTMKGVSDNFIDQHRLDDHIVAGEPKLHHKNLPAAIIGRGISNTLSVSIENDFVPLRIYYVKTPKGSVINPASMYAQQLAIPTAVFTIEKNYDENFIFVPLEVARELMSYGNKRTSLEIKLKDGVDVYRAQNDLVKTLGGSFRVLTNDEQHRELYRILRIEKLFMALAFTLLIAIASINIFFSLMMLVIDKKKDISILASLGAAPALIQKIFVSEAFVISSIGASIGLVTGALLCWLQSNVGLVGMGMENAVVSDYPVKIVMTDFFFVALVIIVITAAIAWLPARAASKSVEARML
jgi:lipoprotein-releasing system permease protein